MSAERDREIRALRPPKPEIDPWRPLDALIERERTLDGRLSSVATLFLAGRECPFTCVFCDLWRFTLDEETPPGSLPEQIALGLEALQAESAACEVVKLYNASNFFDPLAVPDVDLETIARRLEPFDRVVVESHPKVLGARAERFERMLDGCLEVAMGLESVHPGVLPRLNKSVTVADFERAAEWLLRRQIAVRAFVLVGVPFLAAEEQVEWAVRAVESAVAMGIEAVSLIPLRGGNGEMERLAGTGQWVVPTLDQLEQAVERCLDIETAVVTADTWDLERFVCCTACGGHRQRRLEQMNLTGSAPEREPCAACGWS